MAARVSWSPSALRSAPAQRLRVVGNEAISTLRQVALFRADVLPIVPRALAGDDVVVLVHGFFATAGVFRPMRARIERETGALVASFSHAPGLFLRFTSSDATREVGKGNAVIAVVVFEE